MTERRALEVTEQEALVIVRALVHLYNRAAEERRQSGTDLLMARALAARANRLLPPALLVSGLDERP